jgi:EAL domain-containing protein (putative c-di-GMP-specific phosphodiesterase class I)
MSGKVLSERIVEDGALTPLFQPIVRTSGKAVAVHSYECLTRGPEGTNLHAADVLFEYVRLKRMEAVVDRACVTAALQQGARVPGLPDFSVNVHAATIATDPGFPDFLEGKAETSGIAPGRLIVEIVEHLPGLDERMLLQGLDRVRELGIRIALDDVGLGKSNYKMVLDVGPDFLKIDRFFVSHCEENPRRLAVIQSIAELAARFGAQAIAEGVERKEELVPLTDFGIDLIQGYLFSKPLSISALVDADGPRARVSDGWGAFARA